MQHTVIPRSRASLLVPEGEGTSGRTQPVRLSVCRRHTYRRQELAWSTRGRAQYDEGQHLPDQGSSRRGTATEQRSRNQNFDYNFAPPPGIPLASKQLLPTSITAAPSKIFGWQKSRPLPVGTSRPPPIPPNLPPAGGPEGPEDNNRNIKNYLIAAAFFIGMGTGVWFDTGASFTPSNVASTEIIDRKTPNSEICMASGYSSMVFDQRIFVSFNPFNVYVAQPEVKPGCVLRQSNVSVLEKRKLVNDHEVSACTRSSNTFAFVGDLDKSPEVSCVYHSEEAENQFLKNPKRAVLGDGYRGTDSSGNPTSFPSPPQ